MRLSLSITYLFLMLTSCNANADTTNNESDTVSFLLSIIDHFDHMIMNHTQSVSHYEKQKQLWTDTTTDTINIPILMYHNVNMSSDYSDNNSIPIERLEKHFKYFIDQGYTSISLEDYYLYVTQNHPIPHKSLIITFDDGYKSMLQVSDLLQKYNLFATTYIIGAKTDVDTTYHLSMQDIEKIKNASHMSFGTHTSNMHMFGANRRGLIETVDYESGLNDLNSQDHIIDSNTVCYPFGHYNEHAKNIVRDSGKLLALTTEHGFASKHTDLMQVPRIRVNASTEYPTLR